jgi:hypothetical protein
MSEKKRSLLGMPIGTAAHRLRQAVLFALVVKAGKNFCHRCGGEIVSAEEMSLDHVESWEGAADPIAAFFDVDNVGFSHRPCNYGAALRPNKIYASKLEADRASDRRRTPQRVATKRARRARLREAGLPYH